jgi:hypothetical protein
MQVSGGQTSENVQKHDVFLQQSIFVLFCVTQITKNDGEKPLQSLVCGKKNTRYGRLSKLLVPREL